MPQPSIIIPIIVTGVLVGSMLTAKKKITKKRLFYGSLISGLLNGAYGYVLYLVAPPTTFRGAGAGGGFTGGGFAGVGGGFAGRAASGSEVGFLISSFLAGFLFVLAVVGIALLYARYRKGPEEETEESGVPEESEDEGLTDLPK
jgi:hypothetical protein